MGKRLFHNGDRTCDFVGPVLVRKQPLAMKLQGQGGKVVLYRTFRNTDPPLLVEIWNEAFTGRGAKTFYAGPHWPYNPFYLGLYGGCDSPGFLSSDPKAEPFLLRHQYKICLKTLVMQRRLDQPVRIIDPRFAPHRQRFQVRAAS